MSGLIVSSLFRSPPCLAVTAARNSARASASGLMTASCRSRASEAIVAQDIPNNGEKVNWATDAEFAGLSAMVTSHFRDDSTQFRRTVG